MAPQPGLEQFSDWLFRRYHSQAEVSEQAGAAHDEASALTMLITYVYRHTKAYVKKALEATPLTTLDEFMFLASLQYDSHLSKTELIQMHLLEITSGIEVIKRLERSGLVVSSPDIEDKRSRRVSMTSLGREVLEEAMKRMDQAAMRMTGDLSGPEQQQLITLLWRLHDFHGQHNPRIRRGLSDVSV
ncbi:MAG: winged helix DNA-binding protein [Bacteroidia bacterium]|nr:winged helix DNA-binding protein [Bacteroidia bacterium]